MHHGPDRCLTCGGWNTDHKPGCSIGEAAAEAGKVEQDRKALRGGLLEETPPRNRAERRAAKRNGRPAPPPPPTGSKVKGPLATSTKQVHPELLRALIEHGAQQCAEQIAAQRSLPTGDLASEFHVVPDEDLVDAEAQYDPPRGFLRMHRNEGLIVFECERPGGLRLLMVQRIDGQSEGMTWDLLHWVKGALGYADHEAVELYPPTERLINVADMRHLWVLPLELVMPFGLDKGRGEGGIEGWSGEDGPGPCGCECGCGLDAPGKPSGVLLLGPPFCPSCNMGDCDPTKPANACDECVGLGCDACEHTGCMSASLGFTVGRVALHLALQRRALAAQDGSGATDDSAWPASREVRDGVRCRACEANGSIRQATYMTRDARAYCDEHWVQPGEALGPAGGDA